MSDETSPDSPADPLHVWVDADACPVAIKQVLFKTARRLPIAVTLVANQTMRVPAAKLIRVITVPDGPDVADDRIVELVRPGDLVITGDIPLAARSVEAGAIAIGVRGELYDENRVQDRLAARDLMEELRSAGIETRGPKPLTQKDIQAFSNALDRTLTRSLRKRERRARGE